MPPSDTVSATNAFIPIAGTTQNGYRNMRVPGHGADELQVRENRERE